MNHSSQKNTPKIDPWLWGYTIGGLVLVIAQPQFWLGWVCLNICIFHAITVLSIVPHELGHAILARLMGMKVIKIVIGSGRTLFTLQLLGILWEVNQIPVVGMTVFSEKSIRGYRLKNFLTILFGPLTNLLLIVLALQIPQSLFLKNLSGTYLFPGILFYLANAIIVLENLFPHYVQIDGQRIPNDGLQLLTLPFLSKQEIIQRSAIAYVIDGQEWESRGNHERAIESFRQAIVRDPNCASAYFYLGNVYQTMGDDRTAIELFSQQVNIQPEIAGSYLARGMAYYNWRKKDITNLYNAVEDFNQALKLDPSFDFLYWIRGASYSYLGNEVQAIEDFTTWIQLNPNTNAYYNRGIVYYQLANYQAAREDFEQAITLDNNNISARYGRVNAKYALQDEAGALQDYKIAISLSSTITIDPNDEHGFYAKGIADARLGDRLEALKALQSAEVLCLEHGNAKLLQQTREEMQKILEDERLTS